MASVDVVLPSFSHSVCACADVVDWLSRRVSESCGSGRPPGSTSNLNIRTPPRNLRAPPNPRPSLRLASQPLEVLVSACDAMSGTHTAHADHPTYARAMRCPIPTLPIRPAYAPAMQCSGPA
eukprot:1326747-Rhodomonas_salina.3